MKKLIFTIVFAALCGISVFAQEPETAWDICGWYNGNLYFFHLYDGYAIVTPCYSSEPYNVYFEEEEGDGGDFVIPASIEHEGVTYPVKRIDDHAFENRLLMTSVTIPEQLEFMFRHAFKGCENLNTVNYNATDCDVYGDGSEMFEGCTSLTTLNIGENVTKLRTTQFNNLPSLALINFNPTNFYDTDYGNATDILKNSGESATLVIGDNVRRIPYHLFRWSLVSTITIGRNVESISIDAFNCCPNLTTVNFNATNCSSMSSGVWDSEWLSDNNTTITTVNIGDNVITIPDNAFDDCIALTSLTIGNSVRSIGNSAFSGCTGLTGTLTIPNSVTSIGSSAFNKCLISSVRLGPGVRTIGENAFYCINDNVTNMQSVYYSGTLAQWCGITFQNPTTSGGLKGYSNPLACAHNLYIDNNLVTDLVTPTTVNDYAFYNASCLTSVTIPESVTRIGYSAFNYCTGITTINLNAISSTFDVGSGSGWGESSRTPFSGCTALSTLNIGENVTSISNRSFRDCSSLTAINSLAINPPSINFETFYSVPTDIDVLVPCGTVEAYNATSWGLFTNLHQDPDCPTGIEESEIADIELYPTTVTDILNITSSENISEIEIVNVMGQVVKLVKVNCDNATCNVEDLTKGVYFVRIYGNKASAPLSQQKFIKE